METWKNAGAGDLHLFKRVSTLLGKDPRLVNFLFSKESAKLRLPPDELIAKARSLSSGELVLIKLAIDLWCGQGHCLVSELFDYESLIMPRLLRALYETPSAKVAGV
jgi:hypothetical protein